MLRIIFLILFIGIIVEVCVSQSIRNVESISMGGVNTSHFGPATAFQNPANLLLKTNRRVQSSILGDAGFYVQEGIVTDDFKNNYRIFGDYFLPAEPSDAFMNLDKNEAIHQRFFEDQSTFTNRSQYDLVIFGTSWRGDHAALALNFRTRAESVFQYNSHWVRPRLQQPENLGMMNQHLKQTFYSFSEISVAYARELQMLSGWSSRFSTFYMGFAPKIILGGTYFEAEINNAYARTTAGQPIQTVSLLEITTVGALSGILDQANTPEALFMNDLGNKSLIDQNGLGFGVDFGITFVRNMGSDYSARSGRTHPMQQAFIMSFAITDFGVVSYNNQVRTLNSAKQDHTENAPKPQTSLFTGRYGEFLTFIAADSLSASNLFNGVTEYPDNINLLLPATAHFGGEFFLRPFRFAANASIPLTQQLVQNQAFYGSLGAEILFLRIIPIRASISFDPMWDLTYGFGGGVDFGRIAILAAMNIQQDANKQNRTTSMAISTLQVRI